MVLKFLFCSLLLSQGFLARQAYSFVLLSGASEARLPATSESPVITFQVAADAPPISEKDGFAAGVGQLLSDTDYWLYLIQAAMDEWNNVRGSYIRLEAELSDAAALNGADGAYSIVTSSTNLTTAAFARPEISERIIQDCDIAVSERGARAESLAYTLMHELGHCLGLGHNHGDYKAAMSYSRDSRDLSLGLDDEAGVIYLYPEASVAAPRELVSCGAISGQDGRPRTGSAPLLLLFLLPLAVAGSQRFKKWFA